MLTAERLREVLRYDRNTGIFSWRVQMGRARIGDVAGAINSQGYIQISIDGRKYKAHRLAWLYQTGRMPTSQIDHRNRKRHNNWWTNLREATQGQNIANSKTRKDNALGVKGVAIHKQTGKFIAYINSQGQRIHLGLHETLDLAITARRDAERKHHGEYAGN